VCIVERPYWHADEGVFRAEAIRSTCEYVVEWASNGTRCDWQHPTIVRTLEAYLAEQSDSATVTVSYNEFEDWAKRTAQKPDSPPVSCPDDLSVETPKWKQFAFME